MPIGSYTNYVVLPARPQVTTLRFVGRTPQLGFTALSRHLYPVKMTDDLAVPNWTLFTNNVAGTGGVVVAVDPTAGAQSQRLYRVRQRP